MIQDALHLPMTVLEQGDYNGCLSSAQKTFQKVSSAQKFQKTIIEGILSN